MRITRHWLQTRDGRTVHYRRCGEGPAVVLMHGSPQSCWALQPLMRAIAAKGFTAFGFDTPGNGESDPLRGERLLTADYARAFAEVADTLGLGRFGIYGFHTGACIAAEYAVLHPGRVTAAVYDGYCVWTPDERALVVAGYLPAFHPVWDGSHLTWAWARFEDQQIFFPWFTPDLAHRMETDCSPPAQLDAGVQEFLRSGDDYRAPYHAAFIFDGLEIAPKLSQPSLICATGGDPLVEHLHRLPPLGDHITVTSYPRSAWGPEIYDIQSDYLAQHPGDVPPPAPAHPARGFVEVTPGQALAWRGRLDRAGAPLVLLHDAGGSSELFAGLIERIDRPVLALDLPGHGDSGDDWPEAPQTVEGYADAVAAALTALGVTAPAVAGFHLGGQIAVALKACGVASAAGMIGPAVWSAEEADDHIAHGLPDLTPDWTGGHLLKAWRMMRHQALYQPWYRRTIATRILVEPRVDPAVIHRRTLDLVRAGNRYRSAYVAQYRWDATALAGAGGATLFTVGWDGLATPERAAQLAGFGPVTDGGALPTEPRDWGPMLAGL